MKRFIAAVSLSVIAVPAFAAEIGLPYEQTMVDRALPDVPEKAIGIQASPAFGAPYEQSALDRALPNIEPRRQVLAAASGGTRSDTDIASDASTRPVWANDHNFIAPAQ